MPPVVPPFPRLLFSLCLAAASLEAFAGDVVPLKTSPMLSPAAPKGQQLRGPTHIEADRLHGVHDSFFEAEGKVVMRNLREQVEADWIRYDQAGDEARARGGVVFTQEGGRLRGTELKLKLTSRMGEMKEVTYDFQAKAGELVRGEAKTITLQGPDRYLMDNATYSTCPADEQDWVLKVDELKLDYIGNIGSARQVHVEYLNVPILYVPWLDFSLDNSRKSGLLTPTYGATTDRGLEFIFPWYWNIAPNRDATITPRLMTRRGLQLGGEFRYLEPDYSGDINVEVLPDDRLANRSRYRGQIHHRQNFDARWSGNLNYERVSDNTYFTDLSSVVSQTSLMNIPREATLSYDGGWWRGTGRLQGYQTLQDPAIILTDKDIPYRRLPQLTLSGSREGVLGMASSLDFAGEYVNFAHPGTTLSEGGRLHLNPSISVPINTPYSVFTPKLGWFLTRYDLDNIAPGDASQTRSLPMFSLDTSLFLERDTTWNGQAFIQTLEPRAYYLYIPNRQQGSIPVFDSGVSDLSLDQMFSENQFTSVDRINDANQLTLAFTSRYLEQGTGAERLQFTLGQRYYLADQRVTLPGAPIRSRNTTDLIGHVATQVNSKLRLTGGIQYNADTSQISRGNLGGTWREGPGRLFNVDYRYTQDSLNQIDLSAQWPLARKWHGLGRVNYSIEESRMVEALAGFEYNAGCWSLRGVMQRLATSQSTNTNAFFLQLELHGLTKLGPNPLDILKRSITGYVPNNQLAQPDTSPSY
ncbi:MAG: LPS-assembly protein LptD [Pseudomonadota bacterium]|nr:LPS-assembly protein LptD [Pseudomonadota bacterium]MDP1905463.1 LPS-assembly protein LptD [Pseudomonadota bacterium]MDP2351072.1 LPS-assembly protein LptD [Pseudomonadota bacterium]